MLRPRIIPCLLIHDGALVKTRQFSDPKYIGDPINAVRTFNEKEVDEIIILDIDATSNGVAPDYDLIKSLASECRMPMCYGGGVTDADQIEKIVCLGVEKVAVSAEAVKTPNLITDAARRVGSQSVVAVLDTKKTGMFGKVEVVTHNGTQRTGLDPFAFAVQLESLGAGEVVINNVDADGMMMGYDLELIAKIQDAINVPLTALGGAGSLMDIEDLVKKFGLIGCGAGSIFVFKGKHRAVLINYPDQHKKDALFHHLDME